MKAIIVPQDLKKPMVEVEGEGYRKICHEYTHIDWPERVNTTKLHVNNMVFLVDESGHDKRFELNLRALLISEYPAPPGLVGDVVILSEARGEDGGMMMVELVEGAMARLALWKIQERAEMLQAQIGNHSNRIVH